MDGVFEPATKEKCSEIGVGTGSIQYIIKAGLYCIAGFTSLPVNGDYDTNTINTVKDFQRIKNLSSVDGRTGSETFAALFG